MLAPERPVAGFPDIEQFLSNTQRVRPLTPHPVLPSPARLKEDPPALSIYGSLWDNRNFRIGPRWVPSDTVVLYLLADEERYYLPAGKPISEFGPRGRSRHAGLDLKMNLNDSIYASFDGKVRFAGIYSSYGKAVLVRCHNGLEVVYAHLNSISVSVNQNVQAGDLLGRAGRTGRASTVHLHLETRYRGEPFNPRLVFNQSKGMLQSPVVTLTPSSFKIYGNKIPDQELSFALQAELITRRVTGRAIAPEMAQPEVQLAKGSENPSQAEGTNQETVVHIVQKGDTLSALARKYGTSIHSICSQNGITVKSVLRLGQKLQIL